MPSDTGLDNVFILQKKVFICKIIKSAVRAEPAAAPILIWLNPKLSFKRIKEVYHSNKSIISS